MPASVNRAAPRNFGMTLMTSIEAPEDDRKLDAKARAEKAFTILRDLIAKHNLTPDEAAEIIDTMKETSKRIKEARMPYPFTERETMLTLFQPMTESWLHPLANLTHKLLKHHQVVNEPFLIGGIDRETDNGPSLGVVCACFYATVRIKEDEIKVYSNWDRGGMCPEDPENLVAIHPTPDYIKDILPQLESIVQEQMGEGCVTYDVPKRVRLKRPQPELDGPGL